MPIRSTTIASTAVLAVAGLALSGCAATAASSTPNDGTVTLHVGQLGQAKVSEALLEASGENDGVDYEIDTALFDSGPAALEAVPSGQIDVVNMADTPMIFGQVAGTEAHIVAAAKTSAPGGSVVEIVVPAGSDIDDAADLAGKKVATLQGTTLQYSLIEILGEHGLTYDDIVPANLPPADAYTALTNGDVDAAALLDPQRAIALAAGGQVIANASDVVTDWNITVATDAALADDAKADAIEDYVLRLDRAYRWADEHPDEWAKVYAETTGLPLEIATAVTARDTYDLVPLGDEFTTSQQQQADTYAEIGLIPEAPDVAQSLDDRYNAAIEASR
ncbi:ABC transporter substrate-binding protein [Agromyces endophyticus]|uniref:ABC transporter substrate-binding protein n=1 Tax=Agromyces sp. H17E-10 TaxID=2932244 RepID=UPI001FD53339|nr:ABC transporter substrate-binding protein [Agromyces sp. H17E-10]UOQ90186.1 ABC transporter substrate-binding protein [Agromyces sp. H17E-10]